MVCCKLPLVNRRTVVLAAPGTDRRPEEPELLRGLALADATVGTATGRPLAGAEGW